MKPSLLASILRRTQAEPTKFRKTRFSKLNTRTIILLSVLGVGFVVYWLQTWSPVETESDSVAQAEKLETSLVLDLNEKLSTPELIVLASRMDLDPNAELPIQMQWIKDRTEISDQLLAKSGDERAQKEGTLYRLESLQFYSELNRKHDLGDASIDTELVDLCVANLSHGDPEVSKIAAVVIMMTALHRFSSEPSQANLKDAISKCTQISSQLNNDPEIASAIFQYAHLIRRSDLTVDDSVEFFKVVVDQYLHSENKKARQVAENSFRQILFGDHSGELRFAVLLIAGVKDRFRQNRRSVESEVTNRVRYSLHPELLDQQGAEQIFRLIEVLVSNNKIDLASELVGDMRDFLSQYNDETVFGNATASARQLISRIEQFNNVFDLSGLARVGSRSDEDFLNEPSLLIFWEPNERLSNRLLTSLSNLSIDDTVQCIVINFDGKDGESMLVQKLAKEIPGFNFAGLDTETNAGQTFVSNFPVPGFPFMLLLDRDRKVVWINPDLKDLGRRIQTVLN